MAIMSPPVLASLKRAYEGKGAPELFALSPGSPSPPAPHIRWPFVRKARPRTDRARKCTTL